MYAAHGSASNGRDARLICALAVTGAVLSNDARRAVTPPTKASGSASGRARVVQSLALCRFGGVVVITGENDFQ